MQEYLVMVESSDYISVDAESESEAEEKAKSIYLSDCVRECKATVIGPPQPVEDDGIPY